MHFWGIFIVFLPYFIYFFFVYQNNFVPLQKVCILTAYKKNYFLRKDMNILELSEQEIGRRESLAELRTRGIDPYPAAEYPTDAFSTEIIENFVDLPVTGKDEEGTSLIMLLMPMACGEF